MLLHGVIHSTLSMGRCRLGEKGTTGTSEDIVILSSVHGPASEVDVLTGVDNRRGDEKVMRASNSLSVVRRRVGEKRSRNRCE